MTTIQVNETPQEQELQSARRLSVAGFVLGVISVVLALVPLVGLASGIVGAALSSKGLKKNHGFLAPKSYRGLAVAGLVTSIIGIVIGGLATLSAILAIGFGLVVWPVNTQ